MKGLVVLAMMQRNILLQRRNGHWRTIDHGRNRLGPPEHKGVLVFEIQNHLLVATPVAVGSNQSVRPHVPLLHGGDGEGPVPSHLDGGVRGDALAVVVPGEDGGRVTGHSDVEKHVLSLAHLEVAGKVRNDGLVAGCVGKCYYGVSADCCP